MITLIIPLCLKSGGGDIFPLNRHPWSQAMCHQQLAAHPTRQAQSMMHWAIRETYTHKKIKQNTAKCPFHTIPATLHAPFARFAPATLKSFRHSGGGDPFLTETLRGGEYQNFTRTPRGVWVFYGHFSRKVPPPPLTRNSEQSLSWIFLLK